MKTKLVYVIACAPDKYYLEQGVIAAFSARTNNPDAEIVLIVDDKTDDLITNSRKEILEFISQKIVVPFDEECTMMYRSRWIKTSVRDLVDGDFLFIDSDTLVLKPLDEVDSFTCLMGAVPDSHLPVKDFGESLLKATKKKVAATGLDIEKEDLYFSSGVLFVKDCPETHKFYEEWHSIWLKNTEHGVGIDQPSLALANIAAGHLLERIPDGFNCVMYTEPDFAKDSSILHFTAFRNPSWLFTERIYQLVRQEGIPEWMIPFILNPVDTYIPFRYSISKMSLRDVFQSIGRIKDGARIYSQYVDAGFSDMKPGNANHRIARNNFFKGRFGLGAVYCLFPAWLSLKINPKKKVSPNTCAK